MTDAMFFFARRYLTKIGLLWIMLVAAVGDDWPQWLGPDRDGVWREAGIVEQFPEDGLPVLWRTKIGSGYSGPAVAQGKVFLMDRQFDDKALDQETEGNPNFYRADIPGNERVICLRESDGKLLWSYEYPCPYTTVLPYAIGPRCTPTVDGDRVYTLGAEGNLFCFDVASGRIVWSRDFKRDYGLEIPEWGCAAHPLVDGDRLICVVGGEGTTVVAFKKKSGRELWRSLSAEKPGYCPPVIYTISNRRQLIVWHSDAIAGLHPESGESFWSVPIKSKYAMSVGMPRLWENKLFFMSYQDLSAVVSVAASGTSAQLDWKGSTRVGIGGVLNTAFVENGCGYNGDQWGEYRCVRLMDGRRLWSTKQPAVENVGDRGHYWSNVFTVKHEPSDRFFLLNDLGDLIIAELSPEGYREIDRTYVIEPTHRVGRELVVWTHPAFANKKMYYRNDKEIICLALAAARF